MHNKFASIPTIQLRNIILLLGFYIMVLVLCVAYVYEYMVCKLDLDYVTIFVIVWLLAAGVTTLAYIKFDKSEFNVAKVATLSYVSCYIFTLLTTSTPLVFCYIIPYLVLLLIYDSTKLITSASFVSALVTIVVLFYRQFDFKMYNDKDFSIIMATMILIVVFLQLSRVSIFKQFNRLQEIEKELLEDTLTKCNNRKFLEQLIDNGLFSNKGISVILGDVNDLKVINDTRGHSYGDIALVRVGRNLKEVCDKYDNTWEVRLGGDEFVIITDNQFTDKIIEECNASIRADQILKDIDIEVTISFGKAKNETGKMTWQCLYNKADEEMYCCKKNRKIKE